MMIIILLVNKLQMQIQMSNQIQERVTLQEG